MKTLRVIVSIYDEPHDWEGPHWWLPEGMRVAKAEMLTERDPDLSWHDHFYEITYGTEEEVRAYRAQEEKRFARQERTNLAEKSAGGQE